MKSRSRIKVLPRIFITGLLTVLPIIVTLAVFAWLAGTLEKVLGGMLAWLLPEGAYATGMGFAAGVLLVFAVGIVMSTWLAQRLFGYFEKVILRLPVINTLYSAVKDMLALFSPDKERQFGAVVAFCLPGTEARLVGFVTCDSTGDWPGGLGGTDTVAVYLPMSFQIGGYMLLLPRDQLEEVHMPVADALRLTLTAGVTGAGATRSA
ncbi:MAG TPA: DUF502 domain-containing protein [Gammaproteobacteria bacterium]|nr:DUF502 domain-containing protein [Gammaproteobacteria bacterium]